MRPHHAAWVSVLLVLATLALFVGGLFESTALIVLLLIAFMPFVWSLGVRSGAAGGRRGLPHPADDTDDSSRGSG